MSDSESLPSYKSQDSVVIDIPPPEKKNYNTTEDCLIGTIVFSLSVSLLGFLFAVPIIASYVK